MLDCIILAGGLGTRLRSVVSNVPKPMADINGRPFLEWQLEYLNRQGIRRVILSIGYKGDIIQSHFGSKFVGLDIEYAYEKKPLGTGGGILSAMTKVRTKNFFVFNGDTFFPVDCKKMITTFEQKKHPVILMATFSADKSNRYGALNICSETQRLWGLQSAKSRSGDNANGGVYLCNKETWVKSSQDMAPNTNLSFEDDLIPIMLRSGYSLMTESFDDVLIDIGTPDDYRKAKEIFTN